jgi:hypothetical protein
VANQKNDLILQQIEQRIAILEKKINEEIPQQFPGVVETGKIELKKIEVKKNGEKLEEEYQLLISKLEEAEKSINQWIIAEFQGFVNLLNSTNSPPNQQKPVEAIDEKPPTILTLATTSAGSSPDKITLLKLRLKAIRPKIKSEIEKGYTNYFQEINYGLKDLIDAMSPPAPQAKGISIVEYTNDDDFRKSFLEQYKKIYGSVGDAKLLCRAMFLNDDQIIRLIAQEVENAKELIFELLSSPTSFSITLSADKLPVQFNLYGSRESVSLFEAILRKESEETQDLHDSGDNVVHKLRTFFWTPRKKFEPDSKRPWTVMGKMRRFADQNRGKGTADEPLFKSRLTT